MRQSELARTSQEKSGSQLKEIQACLPVLLYVREIWIGLENSKPPLAIVHNE